MSFSKDTSYSRIRFQRSSRLRRANECVVYQILRPRARGFLKNITNRKIAPKGREVPRSFVKHTEQGFRGHLLPLRAQILKIRAVRFLPHQQTRRPFSDGLARYLFKSPVLVSGKHFRIKLIQNSGNDYAAFHAFNDFVGKTDKQRS